MENIIKIKGMSCGHCRARVETALNAMNGVNAKVDLKKKQAVVELKKYIEDSALIEAVTEAGYEVVSISGKKGLFG